MPAPLDPDRDIADQWEYDILGLKGDVIAALNAAGKKGWELIQLQETETGEPAALVKRKPSRIQLATGLQSSLISR